jgi:hypothetical protein
LRNTNFEGEDLRNWIDTKSIEPTKLDSFFQPKFPAWDTAEAFLTLSGQDITAEGIQSIFGQELQMMARDLETAVQQKRTVVDWMISCSTNGGREIADLRRDFGDGCQMWAHETLTHPKEDANPNVILEDMNAKLWSRSIAATSKIFSEHLDRQPDSARQFSAMTDAALRQYFVDTTEVISAQFKKFSGDFIYAVPAVPSRARMS